MSLSLPPICSILIAVLLISSCANSRYQPPTTVSEADRKACEQFAEAEAASVKGRSIRDLTAEEWGIIYGYGIVFPLGLAMFDMSTKNASMRQNVYDAALRECLQPVILEQTLGPDHPEVALSLEGLADLYSHRGKFAEAEPLYKRALAILEKAVGPEHSDVASALERYAGLLRKMNRDEEAERLKARAGAIRAKYIREYLSTGEPEHSAP